MTEAEMWQGWFTAWFDSSTRYCLCDWVSHGDHGYQPVYEANKRLDLFRPEAISDEDYWEFWWDAPSFRLTPARATAVGFLMAMAEEEEAAK